MFLITMTDLKRKTINYDYLNCYNSQFLGEGGNIDSERKTVYVQPKASTVSKDPRVVFAISGKILLEADATEIFFILLQTLSPSLASTCLTLTVCLPCSFTPRVSLVFLLPVSSFLFFLFFSLFNFSSSCFLRLYSFLFSLSCNFFCFSASYLAFFSFLSSKICIDSGPLTNLEYFF